MKDTDHSKLHHIIKRSSHHLMHKLHSSSSSSSSSSEDKNLKTPKIQTKKTPPSSSSASTNDIFERSCTNSTVSPFSSMSGLSFSPNKEYKEYPTSASSPEKTRTLSIVSNNSSISNFNCNHLPSHHNTEDLIPPILDSTTEILTNPKIDFNNVQLICCCDDDDTSTDDDEIDNFEKYVDAKSNLDSSTAPPCHCSTSRSRSRSRSIISNSLLNSIGSPAQPNYPNPLRRSSKSSSSLNQSAKTINFYSFVDMCNKEHLINHPPKDFDGFTSISMKDYMSNLN